MRVKTKNNGRPEDSICKQFAYTTNLGAHSNSSDITELAEIPYAALGLKYNKMRG